MWAAVQANPRSPWLLTLQRLLAQITAPPSWRWHWLIATLQMYHTGEIRGKVQLWSVAEHVQVEFNCKCFFMCLSSSTLLLLLAPRQCSAEELPFASGEVDLVMSMSAAQWFDRPKFLMEADRVLRPGGCLAAGCHTSDAELEFGDVSDTLNDICREVHPRRRSKMY